MCPDIVDGALSAILRGRPGQWVGHSLIGVVAICVPLTLLLTHLARRSAERAARSSSPRVARVATWFVDIDPTEAHTFRGDGVSAGIGALSHVLVDLVSHDHSLLFFPFADDPRWFGASFYVPWTRVSFPGYPNYPIGLPFMLWLVLSAAGAVMLFLWPPRRLR